MAVTSHTAMAAAGPLTCHMFERTIGSGQPRLCVRFNRKPAEFLLAILKERVGAHYCRGRAGERKCWYLTRDRVAALHHELAVSTEDYGGELEIVRDALAPFLPADADADVEAEPTPKRRRIAVEELLHNDADDCPACRHESAMAMSMGYAQGHHTCRLHGSL